MRSFLRSTLTQTSIVAILAASCSVIGCSGDETTTTDEDTGSVEETGGDTDLVDSSVTETESDTGEVDGTVDSTVDSGTMEAAAETSVDSTAAETADTSGAETTAEAAVDTAMEAAACTQGALCTDGKICKTGACAPCTTDTECATASAGTLCIGGACLAATCKPAATPTGCTATGAICCAKAPSAGTCIAPVTGKTTCCADAECAAVAGGLTKCNTTTNTCGCPDPTPGTWYVGPTGNDTTGNGSTTCPFKTIKTALDKSTAAAAATTIILQKAATGVTTYGTGCTGGAPCDVTPLIVPSTITAGLTIKGAGAAADVVVSGGGDNVFGVLTANVSFATLTIVPTKTGTANTGGHGIVFEYATAGTAGTITNVAITGTLATAATAGSGSAIILKGAASETIGTGVTLTGGFHGIRAEGTAKAMLTGGPTTGQTIISNYGGACVFATSASTTAAPMIAITSTGATNDVIIRDCGAAGAVVIDTAFGGTASTISHALITRTTGGLTYPGLSLLSAGAATINDSSITGLLGVGIHAQGTSKLTSTAGLSVTNNVGGVLIGVTGTASGAPAADLAGASIRSNTGDGILCNVVGGTLKLRTTSTIANTGSGLRLGGNCAADLGSTAEFGGNTFNTVTQPNLESGICSNAGGTLVAPAKWKCAVGAAPVTGCGSGLPENVTPPGMFRCSTGKDVTVGGGTTWNPTGTHQCCNAVP